MVWLGIDVGTTGTRALLVSARGHVIGATTEPHAPIRIEHPQWAEQDPEDWWRAAQIAIRRVIHETKIPSGEIAGVGLAGQMHGLVLVDADHRPIGNSLIWCDQRTQEQVDYISSRIGPDRLLRTTCNPAVTGFTVSKLLWVRQWRPDQYARAHKLQLPKDYVRLRLTGEYAMDVADASGTGLLDVPQRRWADDIISDLGFDHEMFPRLYESTSVVGRVTKAASERTGLPVGIPVVAGAGDQAAGAVGNGVVDVGIASSTIGSSGVVFVASDTPQVNLQGRVHTFCHAVPGKWHLMGVTQGAGLSLRWYRDVLASGADYDELVSIAATAPIGSDGVIFLPYLMGERAPHLDADARGAWIGLTGAHTAAHLLRSVMEGVAFSLRDTVEIFKEHQLPISEIRLAGGGARSPLWRSIQADVFGIPTVVPDNTEGAAFGAAILAMVGTAEFADLDTACQSCIAVTENVTTNAEARFRYEKLYSTYRSLYPALKNTMHDLSSFQRQTELHAIATESGG